MLRGIVACMPPLLARHAGYGKRARCMQHLNRCKCDCMIGGRGRPPHPSISTLFAFCWLVCREATWWLASGSSLSWRMRLLVLVTAMQPPQEARTSARRPGQQQGLRLCSCRTRPCSPRLVWTASSKGRALPAAARSRRGMQRGLARIQTSTTSRVAGQQQHMPGTLRSQARAKGGPGRGQGAAPRPTAAQRLRGWCGWRRGQP